MRSVLFVLSGALVFGGAAAADAQVTSRGTRLPDDDDRWRGGHAPVVIRRDAPRECWAWGWGDWKGRDDGRWYDVDHGERRRGRHPGRPVGWSDRDYDRWRKEYDRARRQHAELVRRLEREHAKWHRNNDHRRRDAKLRRQHEELHRRLARQHEAWHRREDPCGHIDDRGRWRNDRQVAWPWPGNGWPHFDLWDSLASLISAAHW